MLDERALRRPDFSPDVPVVLADGQTWWVRICPTKVGVRQLPDGSGKFAWRTGSDELDAALAAHEDAQVAYAAEGVAHGPDLVLSLFDIGFAALSLNYNLNQDHAAELFMLELDSPECEASWGAILGAVKGKGPGKASLTDDPGPI